MKTRTVDKNWDWEFGRGVNDYADESLSIGYSVKMKILSWFRDCFFDANAGIDWKNLLGEKQSKEEIDSAIKKILSTEDGVKDVSFFESSISGRKYNLTARIITIYEETIEVRI